MKSTVTLGGLTVLAVAAGGLILSQPDGASAQVAAKVESQTRPNFGVLLDPPARQGRARGYSHQRRWRDYGHYRPGHRPSALYPTSPVYGGGLEEIVLVDCGGNPGSGAVESAVRRVRPGGTLVLRASSAGACVGWLNIDKPMTIIGEGGFDRRDWDRHPHATLQAPDGFPCLTASAGVRVEVRDVVFASPRGGEAACVVGYNAEFVMNRVGFRHAGDEPAIYADGGLVDIRNSVIEADTIAPAIVADGAVLTAYEVNVSKARVGIEIIPGDAGQPSLLDEVMLKGAQVDGGFGPRTVGLLVRGRREIGEVKVTDSFICGYTDGVMVEGATVDVRETRICRSEQGASLRSGVLKLHRSSIRASIYGVAAESGRVEIISNRISGTRDPILIDRRASAEVRGNELYSRSACAPEFRRRHRDRYAPVWREIRYPGVQCAFGSYRQDWWAEEDGLLGLPFEDEGYYLEGYDRFQQGYGWYTADGRYVYADRPHGDSRWSRW